ncbi:MAG: hypothetical protein QXR53_00545 [Candidatus Norongarragalinales archaeon]
MRAFFSFPAALFFVLAILALAAAHRALSSSAADASAAVLVLEQKHYADVTLKKVLSQVFSLSEGFDEKQSSENIAENLASLEGFAEGHYARQGVEVSLWFGAFDSFEEGRVLRETLSSGRPVRCSHCYALGEWTVDWEGRLARKSVELVFNRSVSKRGMVHTPSSSEWAGEEIAFGATFYNPRYKLAWVSVVREGFG